MSPIIRHSHGGRTRWRPTAGAATLLVAALVAGCGANSHSSTTTTKAASSSSATTTPAAATTTAAFSSHATGPVVYAKCMRASGVRDFPDPSPGRGAVFPITASITSSPAFHSATARCQRYMGGQAGFQTNPSKQTMAKLLRIATCMRAHGIHRFPDPLYNRPRRFTPGEYREITDFDGATLLFPTSMDLQAPAYRQALSACGAPPLGLPH